MFLHLASLKTLDSLPLFLAMPQLFFVASNVGFEQSELN